MLREKGTSKSPEGPSAQFLRTLLPKTIPLTVFGPSRHREVRGGFGSEGRPLSLARAPNDRKAKTVP